MARQSSTPRRTEESAVQSAPLSRQPPQPQSPLLLANQSLPPHPEPKSPTKLVQMLTALSRPAGASLADLGTLTGWQPHSVRAALSGLRKAGHAVTSSKNTDGVTVYRIAVPPAAPPTVSEPAGMSEPEAEAEPLKVTLANDDVRVGSQERVGAAQRADVAPGPAPSQVAAPEPAATAPAGEQR